MRPCSTHAQAQDAVAVIVVHRRKHRGPSEIWTVRHGDLFGLPAGQHLGPCLSHTCIMLGSTASGLFQAAEMSCLQVRTLMV